MVPLLPLESLYSAAGHPERPEDRRAGSPFCARSRVHHGYLCTMRLHSLATSAATAAGQPTGRLVQPRGWILGVELTELLGKLEGNIELFRWFSPVSGGRGFRGPAGLLRGLVPNQRSPRQEGQC